MKKLISLALAMVLCLCTFAHGEISGNSYTNTALGFQVTAPLGWELIKGDADMPGGEDGATCKLVTLTNAAKHNNLVIKAVNFGKNSSFITEELLLALFEEKIESQYYEDKGFTKVSYTRETIVIMDEEHDSLLLKASLYDIEQVQRIVAVKTDNIMIEITSIGGSVEEVDYMLSLMTRFSSSTYINTFLGFKVIAPAGWKLTKGEADIPSDEVGDVCELVSVMDTEKYNSLVLNAVRMTDYGASIVENIVMTNIEGEVISQYTEYGLTVTSTREKIVIMGDEHDSLLFNISGFGLNLVMRCVLVRAGNVMIEIISSGGTVEEADFMVSLVTNL